MAEIKLLRHGFTRRTPDDRLAGFGETEATEDGRVLITVVIQGSAVTERPSATFSPWMALSVAEALTTAAHAALRHQQSLDAEKLIAAGLAAQDAVVARDRAIAALTAVGGLP